MQLVLIGGGDIGRANTKYETKEIDEEIVRLANKDRPNFLFIGLASSFADSYYKVIKDIYKNLGCETGKISNKTLTHIEVVEKKINDADIIYIGGGNTVKLVNTLKETGMDKMLYNALKRNCVLAGISAGAITYLKYGLSDVEIMDGTSDNYVKVDGLGFLDYMFVPHFSSVPKKKEDLEKVLKENKNIKALCADNCCAIEFNDDDMKIIKSKKDASVYEAYYDKKFKIDEIKC
jgi:dipeptidase E